jgi:hypothetical protein
MTDCYYLDSGEFDSGLFDGVIDCTYVLTMEDSDRHDSILYNISSYKLTSKYVVQYNKGYKKCKKNLKKQLPNHDLVHSLQNIFKHALSSGYKRILVLEDDCVFSEDIRDNNTINDISTFLTENDPQVYSLGAAFVTFPWSVSFNNSYRTLFSLLAHANIYNDKYMMRFIKTDHKIIKHADAFPNYCWDTFCYKNPLAYQLLSPTENQQNGWTDFDNQSFVNNAVYKSVLYGIKQMELDTKHKDGFDRLYLFCKIFSVLFPILVLVICLYLYNRIFY